jgi:hypothetical protein
VWLAAFTLTWSLNRFSSTLAHFAFAWWNIRTSTNCGACHGTSYIVLLLYSCASKRMWYHPICLQRVYSNCRCCEFEQFRQGCPWMWSASLGLQNFMMLCLPYAFER